MAPASNPPRGGKKKFDLTHPGAKEYLIVGGAVLAVALVYIYLKKRSAAGSGSGGACTDADGNPGTTDASGNCISSGSAAPSTATGLSTSDLMGWIQDHSSSTTTTTTPAAGTVPDVVGKTGDEAKAALKSAGYTTVQVPPTTPKGESTRVTSQNPKSGAKAAKGSPVAIEVSAVKKANPGKVNPGGPDRKAAKK